VEILVTFAGQDDTLAGAIDIPVRGAFGIPLNDIELVYPQVSFSMLEGAALGVFEGEFQADGSIAGTFSQGDTEGIFELRRPAEASTEPLPYTEEEVTFNNGDITLAGTLTLPEGEGPFPAVLLLTGSGQQNRDEELPIVDGYRPFREIADYLSRQGYAVLRYDDRGIGGSGGDPTTATTEDFAEDARAGLAYLESRPEVDAKATGLLGHSEGAIIAAMLAAETPDVAFVVSLAGPAVSGADVLVKQVERLAAASGRSAAEAQAAARDEQEVVDMAVAEDWEGVAARIAELLQEQIDALPEEQRAQLGDPAALIEQRVAMQVEARQSPWYRFFLAHNPAENWAKVTAPVLAVYGTLDAQVDAAQNRAPLEAALAAAGNEDVTVLELPTANHLFQEAKTGAFEEYAMLEGRLQPALLEAIGDWLAGLK
jgi:pimeloyl-ACP methyl ester carboxylesterase